MKPCVPDRPFLEESDQVYIPCETEYLGDGRFKVTIGSLQDRATEERISKHFGLARELDEEIEAKIKLACRIPMKYFITQAFLHLLGMYPRQR